MYSFRNESQVTKKKIPDDGPPGGGGRRAPAAVARHARASATRASAIPGLNRRPMPGRIAALTRGGDQGPSAAFARPAARARQLIRLIAHTGRPRKRRRAWDAIGGLKPGKAQHQRWRRPATYRGDAGQGRAALPAIRVRATPGPLLNQTGEEDRRRD